MTKSIIVLQIDTLPFNIAKMDLMNILKDMLFIVINVKKTSIYTVDGNYIGTYKSAKYIADHSEEIVGKALKVNSIYDCCNGRIKHYKGYMFINKGDRVAV